MPNPQNHTELNIILALKHLKCATAHQLAEYLGYQHSRWVQVKLKYLHENDRIYITEWVRYSVVGNLTRVWALKTSPDDVDARKPRRASNTVRVRRYRQRLKMKRSLSWIRETPNAQSATS